MIKICTVCGMGLGSSLIVEMNVKSVLNDLNVSEDKFLVTHKNLNSYSSSDGFDYIICGLDLADSIDEGLGKKIILNNIMDKEELREKIEKIIIQK